MVTTAQQVLDTPMGANDADVDTVRDYLIKLLSTLWGQAEDFSSKRPFGNSDWQWEVYAALAKAGLVEGSFDEDGYINEIDTGAADNLMQMAIESLAGSRTS